MASIMYVAPDDDSEVVTYMGVKFFNGQPVDVLDDAIILKADGNPHFVVEYDGTEVAPEPAKRGPGRPRKADETI